MNTNKKIDKVLNKIVSYIDPSSKVDRDWYNDVEAKASTFKTNQEKLEYLEGILYKLKHNDEADKANSGEIAKPNFWPAIAIGGGVFLFVIVAVVLYFLFLAPKSANATNASMTTAPCTFVKSDLTKEDFKIMDYVVSSGNEIKPNPDMKNEQHKVFANGSSDNSLSSDTTTAVNEMIDYMSHNVSALKEKAMTFGLIDPNFDEKKWIENRKGQLYYNKEGQGVFYQVKAFIKRSKVTAKTMAAENSNYYTTGLNKNNQVVISRNAQNLSGQHYIEVRNPENSKDQYCYIVLVYCGNTVMKNNNIPGIPTEKIEIPPAKPGKPDKPSESKVEKKDPSKDPANQGKAPVGGGQNDGSNGSETPKASLPEKYVAPKAPSSQSSSSSSATTPAQDARISEPSQWSGAGKITDSNGTTTVTNDGSVTTPDGRNYSGLTNPSSVPPVESGANGTTVPSSSANFAGNGSMSEPAIDD